jgi:hypothetical protein
MALAKQRGVGRRKSVEFDLLPKSSKANAEPAVGSAPNNPNLQGRPSLVPAGTANAYYQNGAQVQMHLQNALMSESQLVQAGAAGFQPTHRRQRPLSILYKPQAISTNQQQF